MSSRPTFRFARGFRALRAIAGLTLAAAALLLALQASPSQAQAAAPQAPHAASGAVTIVDFAFDPAVVTVTVGSSVQWSNTGTFPHTTTSNDAVWDSGQLAPGAVFSKTFALPGNYAYHCSNHSSMQGRVVVLGYTYLPLIMRS